MNRIEIDNELVTNINKYWDELIKSRYFERKKISDITSINIGNVEANMIDTHSPISLTIPTFGKSGILGYKNKKKLECNICEAYYPGELDDDEDKIIYEVNPYKSIKFLNINEFAIMPNYEPYLPKHMMIISTNHIPKKYKGSQIEIINFDILKKMIEIHSKLKSEFGIIFQYLFAGSQQHFHGHLFDNTICTIDNIMNDIISKLPATDINFNDITAKIDNKLNVNIIHFQKGNRYYGICVQPKSLTNNTTNLAHVVHSILNFIQESDIYTFGLYFGRNNSIFIFPYRKDKTTFRVKTAIGFGKTFNINDYKPVDYITFENISKLDPFSDNLDIICSIHKDDFTYRDNISKYITDITKNKKTSSNPDLFMVVGVPGVGKTKSLKKIMSSFGRKIEDYVYLSLDELNYSNPYYQKILLESKQFLATFLDKSIKDILPSLPDIKLQSILDNPTLLSLDKWIILYKHLFDTIIFKDGKSLSKYGGDIFNIIRKIFSQKTLEKQKIKLFRQKYNIIYEVASTNYLNSIGKIDISDYNKYLINYRIDDLDPNNTLLIISNIFKRNFTEGRIISLDSIEQRLQRNDIVIGTYLSYFDKIYTIPINKHFTFTNTLTSDMEFIYETNKDDIIKEITTFNNDLIKKSINSDLDGFGMTFEKDTVYLPLKLKVNDLFTKNFYNDDRIRNYLFSNFYINLAKIIDEKDKCRLIFKGGNQHRVLINIYLKKYIDEVSKYITDEFSPTITKIKNSINKNFDENDTTTTKIFDKGDFDFTIVVNPKQFKDNDELQAYIKDINIKCLAYMTSFQNFIVFSELNTSKNLINEKILELANFSFNGITIMDCSSANRKNNCIIKKEILDSTHQGKEAYYIESDDLITNYSEFTIYSPYYISYLPKINNTKTSTFDLIRLRYNINCNFTNFKSKNIGAEIIDLSINSTPLLDDWESNFTEIQYSNIYTNFTYYGESIDAVCLDIVDIYNKQLLFPWVDSKINKRFNRLTYLLFTKLLIDDNIEQSLQNLESQDVIVQLMNKYNEINDIYNNDTSKISSYESNFDTIIPFDGSKLIEFKTLIDTLISDIKELLTFAISINNVRNIDLSKFDNNISIWGGGLTYKSSGTMYTIYKPITNNTYVKLRSRSSTINKNTLDGIKFFFENVLPDVQFYDGSNWINLSSSDILNGKIIGAGTFGFTYKINNYLIKILPTVDKTNKLELLKALKINSKGFNKTLAYFDFEKIRQLHTAFSLNPDLAKEYFITNKPNLIQFNYNDIKMKGVKDYPMYFLIAEAGESDIRDFYKNMIVLNEKDKLEIMVKNFDILNDYVNINKKDIFFVHGDIKDQNIIYNSKNEFEIIDFGSISYSDKFLQRPSITTPFYRDLAYPSGTSFLTPFYDIFCIITGFLSSYLINVNYTDLFALSNVNDIMLYLYNKLLGYNGTDIDIDLRIKVVSYLAACTLFCIDLRKIPPFVDQDMVMKSFNMFIHSKNTTINIEYENFYLLKAVTENIFNNAISIYCTYTKQHSMFTPPLIEIRTISTSHTGSTLIPGPEFNANLMNLI